MRYQHLGISGVGCNNGHSIRGFSSIAAFGADVSTAAPASQTKSSGNALTNLFANIFSTAGTLATNKYLAPKPVTTRLPVPTSAATVNPTSNTMTYVLIGAAALVAILLYMKRK